MIIIGTEESMESIWTKTYSLDKRQPLQENIETEIAVIGAGMAGILIAYQLQKTGKKVVVLEAKSIGSGQTKNTTAKITSQHNLIYHQLIKNKGEEKARQYAMANQQAIKAYKQIIQEEQILCDFEETNSYVFSENLTELEEEVQAATKLGLPASLIEEISLPFPTKGAVKFERQAQFHPLKFLQALSERLTIYENTFIQRVEDHTLVTARGTVTAKKIIFACHYPFVNFPGMYFTRMHQERSYVLALKNAGQMDGIYIGEYENRSYSFRNYGDLLLFGGEGHRTGENSNGGRYESLRKKAKQFYPNSYEVAYWSAQDCISSDSVPFIGNYSVGKPDWYVATGFQKWGMTSSMVSSLILRDMICGIDHPYAEVFSPQRFSTEDMTGLLSEGGQAMKGLSKRFFQVPNDVMKDLPLNHGGIIQYENEKIGVYKDKDNTIYAIQPKCPHLGCQLEWNPDELSWDCPCHGSRFDYKGNQINGPAQEGIAHE